MANYPSDQQRPAMRRKSSAQNLLSSFKPNSQSTPIPAPLNVNATGTISSATGLSFASAATAATPTASTPFAKDWDAQSLHSDTVPSTLTVGSPSLGPQGTSVEYLRDLVQKRIITLTYLRNVHEGKSHWFHTILLPRSELEKSFTNIEMKKRTSRFAVLGMSLSNLLDVNQPSDLLRGLMNIMTEYDQAKEDGEKPKMRLFRPKASKRQDFTGTYSDSADATYLVTPHVPYPLDYHQTLLSLLDILSEVYNKISKILGPSPIHHSQYMMGPLGLLSPHPGVSYLFSPENATNGNHSSNPSLNQLHYNNGSVSSPDELNGSLWGIANAGMTVPAGIGSVGGMMYSGTLGSPPATWASTMGDSVLKIDSKFKKITGMLLKDLDQLARKGIRDELEGLLLNGDDSAFDLEAP
ncbi:hypothetical protein AX16_004200 [Volvariella volvacea WC 439]|nr:hypothetical protein AX16_004200 [Volvariella volvacea WC 439]